METQDDSQKLLAELTAHDEPVRALSYEAVRLTVSAREQRLAENAGKFICADCQDTGIVPAPEPYGSMGCRWGCSSCEVVEGVRRVRP